MPVASRTLVSSSRFHLGNRLHEPGPERFLNVVLIAPPIERIESLFSRVKRNLTARYFPGTNLRRHKLHQHAIAARRRIVLAIVIHARRRVFEDKLRTPRLSW